ncbi:MULTISPECIES: hypothetical protein [Parabacteroides]|uniref:Uncharacterized protein n=1 Tax=Parabacteroides chinchillae TaxID=871327 RepID=A0A8G2BUS0_9BACT|nr:MULTISPECIES: hypothetical protein [Parabacteroides]SEF60594.1 hypothetical protein SAMN05444001_103104 [Parabacteroides chinchillae]
MNKIFFITFVAISVLSSINAFGQEKRQRHFDREAFQAKRNAFITAEVGLTPEEAALFIPLCDEFRQKTFEASRSCRKLSKQLRSKDTPTDVEYTEAIDACLEAHAKEVELEKEYFNKFKKILSPEKLYKYKEAENRFMRSFIRESGEKKVEKQKK